jgi:hypothetical protein
MTLGEFEPVDLRTIWNNEATDVSNFSMVNTSSKK